MTDIYRGPTLEVPEVTKPGEFFRTVDRFPDRPAVTVRAETSDEFITYTWEELGRKVTRVAHGLLSLGVEPGDRVAIQSKTRYEWLVADLAVLAVGGITTTVYTTLSPDQVEYNLNDSRPKVVVSSGQEQFDKVRQVSDEVESVERFVVFDPVDAGELEKRTLTLNELMSEGDDHHDQNPDAVQERLDAVEPGDDATIVYTSGTTGLPKGTVLTHRNFISASQAFLEIIDLDETDTGLAFLPLAHVYQRLTCLAHYRTGIRTIFTSPAEIGDDLKRFQPTLMASVPRIYEKIYDKIVGAMEEAGGLKQTLFERASDVAREYGKAISNAGRPGPLLKARHAVYDRLVYDQIREQVGAQNLRYVITGAAAIREDLLYWYRGVGVPILEGYGLTETSAPSNINLPDRFKPGTVGPPFPGMEQKIDDETGEVLMKGPNVFDHYWELEDETEEAFTDGGWFRSGDIGKFDEDGYLEIVDRLKQIEVLSTGKNVAPVPIEEAIKRSDWVAEAMVVGSDRKFVTALVEPNYQRVLDLAEKEGIAYDEDEVVRVTDQTGETVVEGVPRSLLEQEQVREPIQRAIDDINPEFSDFEQVKKFRLVPHSFTVDRDELTPTLKKKRRNIRENWSRLIEDMYPEDD